MYITKGFGHEPGDCAFACARRPVHGDVQFVQISILPPSSKKKQAPPAMPKKLYHIYAGCAKKIAQ
jgi:hypothetical protein